MKLRRVLAAAAVTAAIAPAALMAAPLAYAADGDATASTMTTGDGDPEAGTTETGDGTETGTGEEATAGEEAADGESGTGDDSATGEDGNTAGDGTESGEDEDSAGDGTETGDGTGTGEGDGGDGTGSGEEGDGDADETTPGEDEAPPFCEELDEDFAEKALQIEVGALPGKIVAGSGWHSFSLKVTNTSDVTLKDVAFYAEVESTKYSDDWKPDLSQYADLQFLNPTTQSWESIEDANGLAGGYFWGTDTLKPNDFNKIDLRVNIHKDAPAGEAYHFGTGAYVDNINGEDCIAENWGDGWFFDVLPAGTSNEDPGEAKPGAEKPANESPKKPQGGVSEQPVTGSLAETGSDSNLPVIATIGGVAVLAGAGVIFAMKRRKAGAEA
ncbi:LPXTG cell wall anchor domain-containing protein [Streptomyces sp. TRM68416]|uniref:LPXTG cell wall anchor domain-containing protein n=1 Tax=Streptomyces sp. TRM68416 TaxID=2758412 RepID=UPI001661AACF|nr:LPXTG cell wall anchor domain-containing protein [Streptomyces sp. TRM68416]MBD0839186.1 LPXTG cell wall anchor domain-containing protein [Streptomyces sp. TRM68416]